MKNCLATTIKDFYALIAGEQLPSRFNHVIDNFISEFEKSFSENEKASTLNRINKIKKTSDLSKIRINSEEQSLICIVDLVLRIMELSPQSSKKFTLTKDNFLSSLIKAVLTLLTDFFLFSIKQVLDVFLKKFKVIK